MLLSGQSPATRIIGFFFMVLSNGFFFLYGVQVMSTALMIGSMTFMVVNINGMLRNVFSLKGKE